MTNENNKEGFVNVQFLTLAKYVENNRFVKIRNSFNLERRALREYCDTPKRRGSILEFSKHLTRELSFKSNF